MYQVLLKTLAVVCLLLGGCVDSSEQVEILRVGTSGDYEPFSLRGEDGRLQGFDIELARRFAADQDLKLEFVPFKWPELLSELRSGEFDVAMSGITIREDRSLSAQFSIPTATSGAVALLPKNSQLRSMEEINQPQIRVGVNQGGHLERVTRQHLSAASIVVSSENQALPAWLNEGRIDVLITDTMEAPFWFERIEGARALPPFTNDFKAVLVRADRSDLAHKFNAWLHQMESSGQLGRLRDKWLPSKNDLQTADPIIALLVAMRERLSLMVAVAEAKRVLGRPVEDLEQEARVLNAAVEGVNREAGRAGIAPLNDEIIRSFFQAQMDAAKAIQHRTLENDPTMTNPPDLVDDLRPALGRISARINGLIIMLGSAESKSQEETRLLVRMYLSSLALGEPQLALLEKSLIDLILAFPN